MADYVPPIEGAIARLATNDVASRSALYARAREALVAQLREIMPALSNLQLLSERADLEAAIRKIEAQHVAASQLKPGVTPILPMPRLFTKGAY